MGDDFTFEETNWDNEFFNLKSGKIVLNDNLTPDSFSSLLSLCKNYDLVVINNPSFLNSNDLLFSNLENCTLCDINIQFKLSNKDKINVFKSNNIEIGNFYPYNKEILDISKTSFSHSRFLNDKNLDPSKSKDIYFEWCINSFNKPKKYFSVFKENNKIYGFLLFSLKDNQAYIELIAVDSLFKNNGIGKKLINSTLFFLNEFAIQNIYVGTQYSNIQAIKFYESLGFKVNKISTIHHYWPNKK